MKIRLLVRAVQGAKLRWRHAGETLECLAKVTLRGKVKGCRDLLDGHFCTDQHLFRGSDFRPQEIGG